MNQNKIDELMKRALTPDDAPGELLNQKILNRGKGMKTMKHKTVRAAVAAAALVATTSITAYAAAHFLGAGEIAEQFHMDGIASAFEDADGAVQTLEQGGYRFALLGIVAGAQVRDEGLSVDSDGTYVVIAAEHLDGSEVSQDEEFVVSALIQGLDPFEYNVYSMGGGATYNIMDGRFYMIMSCDNIEIFADRQLYVAITTGPSYRQAYDFDETTGLITRKEEYDGINVLFPVELDASKADRAAQAKYLSEFGQEEVPDTPYQGDTGTAPMKEQGCSHFENEYLNFALSIDYSLLDDKVLEEDIMTLGTLKGSESGAQITGYSVNDFEDGEVRLFSQSASDVGMDMTFMRRDGDKLICVTYEYDLDQTRAIYEYFH